VKSYLLLIRYDGTDFHGWQRQPGVRSVQGELEVALERLLGEPFRLGTSSRTDAGVHARRHPASLETDAFIPLEGLCKGLNALLPPDVAVVQMMPLPAGSSARKSSLGKTYRYSIYQGTYRDPHEDRNGWWIKRPLDLEAMARGGRHLVGEHDFTAFRSAQCGAASPRRLLTSVSVVRQGKVISIWLCGNAFLRNMVRIMAGSLVEVGLGRHSPDWIGELLVRRDRTLAGPTAPARGLCLVDVSFPPDLLCDGAHRW